MLSLRDCISAALVDGQLPEGFSLPPLHEDENELFFADGAMDSMYLYHFQPEEILEEEKELLGKAITAASNHDFDLADQFFLELSKKKRAIVMEDELHSYILEHKETLKPGNIYEYAIIIIKLSDNRECVKYGLLLLGLLNTNNEALKNVIRTLALSDEFTLYCVHIMNHWPKGNDDIFEVAKKVHGWGKIHAVKLLRALLPRYDEIREWMLKEGIQNTVMPSYSALTVWKNASIGSILFVKPTYEELTYIGKIIDAMLDESAIAGISTLDKRQEILLKYLEKAQTFTLSIEDYEVIYDIYQYAKEKGLSEVILIAKSMLQTTSAKEVLLKAIQNGRAIEIAKEFDIDVKPHVLKLLKEDFMKYSHLCHYLVQDKVYRDILLHLFETQLPLEEMKTEPTLTHGLGKEYENQRALEFLMQELRNYPFEGEQFIEVGLQSKPTRTRNGALTVLQNWVEANQKPLSKILPSFHSLLTQLVAIEPNEGTKELMNKLIRGDISFEEKPQRLEDEEPFSQDTLNILSDAISDIGCWQWWHVGDGYVQIEFGGVQLYDDTKEKEKQAHSSTIALRISLNACAVFLDNLDDEKWHEKLQNDEISPFELDTYEFEFNNVEYAKEVLKEFKHQIPIIGNINDEINDKQYLLAAKCNGVGFVAMGDELEVLTHHGRLSKEEIQNAHKRWWRYWEDYWAKRGTKEAYEKDFACEATIPVDKKNPIGEWHEQT